MDASTTVTPTQDVLAKEVGGEIVLLDLASGTYFGLAEVGARTWQLMAEKARTIGELCNLLQAEYDVDAATLEADVVALCRDLADKGLLAATK